ncbi:MAG TPA: hypothetical protein VGN93_04505 [Shinella sp.]|uniref:hypothetical protein n=1 Tax=Shinella sp. TaxID=1870904 RepID=UPI002E1405AC|nr:hypothetical protein [Shinella sp.]
MTTEISQERYDELFSVAHQAILLTVEKEVSTEEASAINKAIADHLVLIEEAGDMRPVWVRFQAVSRCDIHHLQCYMAPSDRSILNGLILAVDAVNKYTMVSSFDFRSRQWPKKAVKKTKLTTPPRTNGNDAANPAITRKLEFNIPPNPSALPMKLRFMACEEAMREAYKLGDIYDRWPFFGFDRDDLRVCSDKLVAEFGTRYPYLAEADAALGGKITAVVTELGKHPYQPAFERKRFWMSVKAGGVNSWTHLADELLAVIAKGAGDDFKYFEEPTADTLASSYIYSDDRTALTGRRHFVPARRKPPLTTGNARGMVAED